MQLIAQDDDAALRTLVGRHQGLLMNFFIRSGVEHYAEDLVQETFIRLYRYRRRYRPTARFTTFLHTLARNVLVDHVRRRGRWFRLLDAWQEEKAEESDHSSDSAPRRLDAERALETLSGEMKSVVVLVFYQGLSYQDAADVLGVPVGTIKSRMFNALRQLRAYFESSSGEKPL